MGHYERVLVRAFGHEPLRRLAVPTAEGRVMVVTEALLEDAEERGVAPDLWGWPQEDIFVYDSGLEDRLEAAFRASDGAALLTLWKQALPYTQADHGA